MPSKGAVTPREACTGGQQDLCPLERDQTTQQYCWQNLRPHGVSLLEEPDPEELNSTEGTHIGAGEECEDPSTKEGKAETMYVELATTPNPHSSALLVRRREIIWD